MTNARFRLSQKDLLLVMQTELELHPKLELCDLYKLVYQACFGPGHLLDDPAAVAQRIFAEVNAMQGEFHPLLQDIGNGIGFHRFSLSHFKGLDPNSLKSKCELLAELMLSSSDMAQYERSISDLWPALKPMIADMYPATPVAWQEVNAMAAKALLPHHSEIYRQNYHPHYRLLHLCCSDKIPQLMS